MNDEKGFRLTVLQGAFLGFGLLAVFLGPYLFRPVGVISDAYMAGFSTRAAMLLLVAVAFGFAWWARGAGMRFPDQNAAAPGLSRTTLYWTVSLTLSLVALMCVAMHFAGPLNEANYFADRMLMQQSGARVFRDFEYPYGPLLFYFPSAIHTLTRLSWANSYLAGWFLEWVAGSVMLWKTVQMATAGTRAGKTVYLLLWSCFLPFVLDGGAQYTPLRFCATLLLALVVQRLMVRSQSMLEAAGVASAGIVFLICYSPEQAIVYGAATLLFFSMQGRSRRKDFLPALALFAGTLLVSLLVASKFGWLNGVKAFGGGGFAFPLVISPQNVMILLLLVAAACGAVTCVRERNWSHPLLYLCLIAGASLPAALGRSDIGHLFLNLLGALIAAFLVLWPRKPLWRLATVTFALFVAGWITVLLFQQRVVPRYAAGAAIARGTCGECTLAKRFAPKATQTAEPGKPDKVAAWFHATNDQLPQGQTFLMPFGGAHRAFDFAHGNEALSGTYDGLIPLVSVAEVQEKVADLEAHPADDLLIPQGTSLPCDFDLAAERKTMRSVLLPLYTPKLKQASTAAEPFCTYVAQHYRPVSSRLVWQGMTLWQPVTGSEPKHP